MLNANCEVCSELCFKDVVRSRPLYVLSYSSRRILTEADNTHLKGPDSSDPHLEWSISALNAVELDALPPAAASWLAPEKKKLLCHANGVGTLSTADIGAKASESEGADYSLVWLAGAVAPAICMVEAAKSSVSTKLYLVGVNSLTQQSTSQSDAAQWCQSPRSFSIR